MNEGANSPESDFRELVYRNRAVLYESAMTVLKALLGPKWSYRLEPLGKAGRLALKSPLMYVIKGEFEIPLTINTRGNQLRILTQDGGTFHNLREMAAELERIVQNGHAPTHQEVSDAEAARRLEINRRRGTRKAKARPNGDQTPLEVFTEENSEKEPTISLEPVKKLVEEAPPPTASSSVARTPTAVRQPEKPRPTKNSDGTYLQHEFDAAIGIFNRNGINDRPLADDPSVRIRRLSVLSQVQGLFRRVEDHLSHLPGDFKNVTRFAEVVQDKVSRGTIFSGEQYDSMCAIIEMLSSEIMTTNPPNILRSHLDRLLKEIKVF